MKQIVDDKYSGTVNVFLEASLIIILPTSLLSWDKNN